MSESTGVIPRSDEADTEVELSAEELLALSDCRHIDERQPLERATSASQSKPDAPAASTNGHVSASRRALFSIVSVGMLGAAYVLTTSGRASQSTANTSQATARPEWSPPEQIAGGEPVRFSNPFDTQEVFEFPPGTTETEAREAVAEVLMERAMSRQRT